MAIGNAEIPIRDPMGASLDSTMGRLNNFGKKIVPGPVTPNSFVLWGGRHEHWTALDIGMICME
jgi:hypothetical protein